MQLNIKNGTAYTLAQKIAAMTGESLTQVVTGALETRLISLEEQRDATFKHIMNIGKQCADSMSDEAKALDIDSFLYDEYGLPEMIVDSSVLVAILRQEPECEHFSRILSAHMGKVSISAANYLETAIVIESAKSPTASAKLDELLEDTFIEIAPVTPAQAKLARAAYRTFGRGSGHAAALNFGDCFAYALAKDTGKPLLYKGYDFEKTDVMRGT